MTERNLLWPLSELSLANKQCWAAVRSSGKSLLFAEHCSIWFFTEASTYKIKKGKKGEWNWWMNRFHTLPYPHQVLRSISGDTLQIDSTTGVNKVQKKLWLYYPNHFMEYLHYVCNRHNVTPVRYFFEITAISTWNIIFL